MKREIVLHRKNNKPVWIFKWDDKFYNAFIHETKKGNIYRLFIDYESNYPDIWIGRLFLEDNGDRHWCTWENTIKADWFKFGRVTIKFNY